MCSIPKASCPGMPARTTSTWPWRIPCATGCWISTVEAYLDRPSRTVAYLSAEFLVDTHLGNNLVNLGIYDDVRAAMASLKLDLDFILAQEQEYKPGLGNVPIRLQTCPSRSRWREKKPSAPAA